MGTSDFVCSKPVAVCLHAIEATPSEAIVSVGSFFPNSVAFVYTLDEHTKLLCAVHAPFAMIKNVMYNEACLAAHQPKSPRKQQHCTSCIPVCHRL